MEVSNFFIIFTISLSFIFRLSHGFKVIQPQNRTVNPDRSASISCEHTAQKSSVQDVRLDSISSNGTSVMLCQKGKKNCRNVVMYTESPNKYIFIILNIQPEMMTSTYQCEVTVKDLDNDVEYTDKGTPTRLLQGPQDTKQRCEPPPPLPPSLHRHAHHLRWILIGLLAVMSLYSCIITSIYIRLRFQNSSTECENSTYVEMRKAPLSRNQHVDIHYV